MYTPETTPNPILDNAGHVVGQEYPILTAESAKELAAMFPDLVSGVTSGPPNFKGNPFCRPETMEVPYLALNNGTSVMAWWIAEYFALGWPNAAQVARQQLVMTMQGL